MRIFRLNKAISKTLFKKLKSHHYLTIIGGLILFCSWIVEKNIKQNWTEAKENHLESTINSSFRQVQRLNAETMYYEAIRKEEIDSGQIAFSQVALVDIYLGLMDSYHSKEKVDRKEYKKFYKNAKRIMNENKQYIANGNYYEINNIYNQVAKVFRENFDSMKKRHQTFLNNIVKKETKWNNIFIGLYTIGSLLLGIGYLKNIIYGN